MDAKLRAVSLLLGIVVAGCGGAPNPPASTPAPAIPASPATAVPASTWTATPAPTPTPTPTPAAPPSPTPAAQPTSTPSAPAVGGEIAFTSTVDGVDGVSIVDVASGRTTGLADGAGPAWSPDGTRIAFGRASDAGFTLWVMNADGSGLRSLGSGLGPSWSPDGTRIAFATSPIDLGDLWVMNANGSGRKKLEGGLQRDWSPDGTRIASVTGEPGGAEPRLVVARVDGSGAASLAKGQLPAWSPDGTRIAFVSWSEQPAIQVVDLATGTVETIVQLETEAYALAWSPDGTRLSFVTPGGDLRVVAARGGEVATAATGLSFDAARSPDGGWFAFTVRDPESPTSDIYLARADGSDRRQLTTTGAASGPAWRPAP